MKVLHLSDTPLSGSPIRISNLLNKYSDVESRHVCWSKRLGYRIYPVDVVGSESHHGVLRGLLDWADVIHYHNRWKRQDIFKSLEILPPNKPSVIQIHSPRESEDFSEESGSGLPIACVAQYHPRQWPECRFIVPNVVDIYAPEYLQDVRKHNAIPMVSFAPSNTNCRGWDDKGYSKVNPILKRMRYDGSIVYDLIQKAPFDEVMSRKRWADIGIDDTVTGSYHLSALEYLALGIPCVCHLDEKTTDVVKKLTGSEKLPFIDATKDTFSRVIKDLVRSRDLRDRHGAFSRKWMEEFWNPEVLAKHYIKMYQDLL